jgi:hypothetical protein
MASVAVIYAVRKLAGMTALKIYALVLSVFAIGKLVWVSKVLDNFFMVEKHGLGAMSNYLLAALEHTNVAVQLTLLVAALVFVSLLVDFVKSVSAPRTFVA